MRRIIADERPINALWSGQANWTVGHMDVTKIIPYEENGQMSKVTWFAIYQGDTIVARVSGGQDTVVCYKEQE